MDPRRTVELMRKLAGFVEKDLREDTPVVTNFKDFQKKLEPGDIILSKERPEKQSFRGARKFYDWWTGSRWIHAAMYTGNGKVTHSYPSLEKGDGRPSTFRELFDQSKVRHGHSLRTLSDTGNDFIVVRPDLPKAQRTAAAKRIKSMQGLPYSPVDFLRTGFARRGPKKGDEESLTRSAICTGAVSAAYPKVNFNPKYSRRFLRGEDFLRSSKVKGVAAFSADYSNKAKLLKANIGGKERVRSYMRNGHMVRAHTRDG